jgi:hypothetical protein
MAFADTSVYNESAGGDGTILGGFREADYGHYYEFSENIDELYPEYPHKIWVTDPKTNIDQGYRYGRVLKTRCKILVDEGVEETWHFKQNSLYRYGEMSERQRKIWDKLNAT